MYVPVCGENYCKFTCALQSACLIRNIFLAAGEGKLLWEVITRMSQFQPSPNLEGMEPGEKSRCMFVLCNLCRGYFTTLGSLESYDPWSLWITKTDNRSGFHFIWKGEFSRSAPKQTSKWPNLWDFFFFCFMGCFMPNSNVDVFCARSLQLVQNCLLNGLFQRV